MEKLADQDEPAANKRSARRRLVQSTLFPHKSQEIEFKGDQEAETNGDQEAGKDCDVDGDNEDDQEYCSGSQGKKTRKRKGKTTSQAKTPKKLKEKSSKNTTPKKNGKLPTNLMENEDASPPPIPNLRLEAKLTAEENSRMFSGKQIHPFFSSWKVGKRNQEMTEVDGICCSVGRKDKRITIGPIHVFERVQDEVVTIDWKNWTFYEKPFTNCSSAEGKISSVFKGSAESLKLDKSPSAPLPYDPSPRNEVSSVQYSKQEEHLNESSPTASAMLVDNQETCCQLVNSSCEDHQLEDVTFLSEHAGSFRKPDIEEKSRYLQERMMLNYSSFNQPEDTLWIEKYQPKNAMEVCGNNQSVKFMSEWLHLWYERDFRAIKDSLYGDKGSMQDNDHDYYGIDSDSENVNEDRMKNVLLVIGPVGSGKSAAIHACANENGFKVLENNTSDCRNGALVRQKFGEALESHCLSRSLGNAVDSQSKNFMISPQTLCNGEAAQQVDSEVIELIPKSDEDIFHGVKERSGKFVCKERVVYDKGHIKPLILFEDVDILFPEDRGFIAAVQQISDKAKGPVILTSNSNDISLPDNLDRLEVFFTMPSSKDLRSHIYMICAAEKVEIQPHLIEQLIAHCRGDIRKTIMHLQFWCQNEIFEKDKKMQKMCGLPEFDPEIGHQILPEIIPWNFPSPLSELVEKEISVSLSLMEENSTLVKAVEWEGQKEMLNSKDMHNNEIDSTEAKKEAMLSRNYSVPTSNKFADLSDIQCELHDFPGSPVSFSRRNNRRKFNVVTSSDSEDELFGDGLPIDVDRKTFNELFLEDNSRFPSHFSNAQNCIDRLNENLFHPEAEKNEEHLYRCPEITNDLHMNGTCESIDLSCVPESSFVPETEIDYGVELSATICSGYVAETVEVSVSNEFIHELVPVLAENKSTFELCKSSDILENFCDVIGESSHREEVVDSQNEHAEAISRGYQVMDECSRMETKRMSKPMEKLKPCMATDLVKESWQKLHGSNEDLKGYVASENSDAFPIVKLAYGMCKLISEADLLLSKCRTSVLLQDFLEFSMFPCEESVASSWYDEHLQMTSTIVQHGFCFCAKEISTIGSKMGSNAQTDLTREMISTTNMMALRKLIGQNVESSGISNIGNGLELSPAKSEILLEREMKLCLFNTIKSLVPKKSYLGLKGVAFHEYLSSLGCISRSETSRLSECINKTKGRRARRARHYLSTGTLMLSPEDVSLLSKRLMKPN
ncbi:hypothetical protein Dsin_002540 [Dipteronia sinensis]|uniref:ATPase family AAA domain-containing protein 5 n=1 Tax=Dipteronia sinensis TaxID=43782 RepID=A0AAE0B7Q2_9ROSI|nr:hypothetical protein Dsin_002540 [Dipteronia sinensis]